MVGGNMKKAYIIIIAITIITLFTSLSAYNLEGINGYGDFDFLNTLNYNKSMIVNSASIFNLDQGLSLMIGCDYIVVNEKRSVKLFDSYDNYLADYTIYENSFPYYGLHNFEIAFRSKYVSAGLVYAPFRTNAYNYNLIEHDDYYVKTGEIIRYIQDNSNRVGFVLGATPLPWLGISGSYQNIQGKEYHRYEHLFVDVNMEDTTIIDKYAFSGNLFNVGINITPGNFVKASIFTRFRPKIRIQDDRTTDTLTLTYTNYVRYPYVFGGEIELKMPNKLPVTLIVDGNYTMWNNIQITTPNDSVYYDNTLNNSFYIKVQVEHKLSSSQRISFGTSVQQSYIETDLLIPSYIISYTYHSDNNLNLTGTFRYVDYGIPCTVLDENCMENSNVNFSNYYFNIILSKSVSF